VSDLQNCQRCPRLTDYRIEQKIIFPEYHCLPVAGFGPADAKLLIVGLAPGLHGANASGRPFTGDASGDMLFATLHKYGFASQVISISSDDNMHLVDCRITNAVKCVPPQNRPHSDEIERCNTYLRAEISSLCAGAVILALGTIAHRSILQALELQQSKMRFAHLAEHQLSNQFRLIDSYHCSRYNINTGRLNQAMFEQVFKRIRQVLQ
jgi:uracil-DNA glycosylase family 4